MSTTNLHNQTNDFIAIVTGVDDPDQMGALQIMPLGWGKIEGQEGGIANTDGPWAKPDQGILSAGQNQIGTMPVGAIVGSWVHCVWQDTDMQICTVKGTIHSAGDIDPKGGSESDGRQKLAANSASTPVGGRSPPKGQPKTNKFVTRSGKSIKEDDHDPKQSPPVQKDEDAKDVTAEAKSNTSYGTNGTTGSITNPVGSILKQITKVDPKNLNAVLPNAVDAFQKMKDLSTFSSPAGVNGLLGQALGAVMNGLGASTVAQALGTALSASGLSSTSVAALQGALSSVGSSLNLSDVAQSVVGPVIDQMSGELSSLISGGGLNTGSFNQLMSTAQSLIQNAGAMATIGTNLENIMNDLDTVLPSISSAIKDVQTGHFAEAVLDITKMGDALKKFAMNQAFVKAPDKGKKSLAKKATDTVKSKAAAGIKDLPNVTPAAKQNLTDLTAYPDSNH